LSNAEAGTSVSRDHFSRIAPDWSHFGPPMRPHVDDTAIVQRLVATLPHGVRAVVLGLTPEIVACDWPPATRLSAVDHSPAMIAQLWPPARGPAGADVIVSDWRSMPIPSASVDFVVGDGCYVMQAWPDGYAALTREVARTLRPGGRYAIRVFLRPDEPEAVAAIAAAFVRGDIGSVHAMKLRLLAALHGASGAGTRLDDVAAAWQEMPPLPAALVGARGWTAGEIGTLTAYAGIDARYYLPTLDEFRGSLRPFLRELECVYGGGELAERCPTLVFVRD
jgi:SAM-dependent methyltransferase